MAYVLGFFCADGAMTINPCGSKYLDFDITDKDLLLKIKRCLNAHQIITRRNHNKGKDSYRLQIGSKKIFNDLLIMGLTPKKTFRFNMPFVPTSLFSHFVRGYFDGDGCILRVILHKERKTQTISLRTVFTSGNKKFLQELAFLLNQTINITGFFANSKQTTQLIYSVKPSLSLYQFMYNDIDSFLYLERKKAIFERYINEAGVAQPG